MKHVALTGLLLVGVVGSLHAQDAGTDLVVHTSGLRHERGTIRCYLFASADGYPTRVARAVARATGPVEADRTADCTFHGVAPGEYAVAVHHDEDDDGNFDTGIFGIPMEGTAASRDARGSMGPPSFESARITHGPGPSRLTLTMQYVL